MTTDDRIDTARRALLDPGEISEGVVSGQLARLTATDIDAGELFFQVCRDESWSLEDGAVKGGSFSVDRGVGVRAISGEKTGFAYAEDIGPLALGRATDAARSIARTGHGRAPVLTPARPPATPMWIRLPRRPKATRSPC